MAKKITTENALKKLDKQLECPLCLDPFKEPKLFPCFHIFCKSPCLEKLVARDGQSLQCLICRHIVPLPAKGVSGLQPDFHVAHLFEIKEAFSKVEQSTGKHCEYCEEHQATGYCHDCEQFACDSCQLSHKRVKSLKKHKFITLDQLQYDSINLIPPKKTVSHCPKHSNKELEIYCETCHELLCNNCTVRLHKDHNYDLVGDVFTKYKEKVVSGLRLVRENLDTVQQTLKAFDSRAKEINEQRVTLEADIQKEFDQLQRLLDQRRVQLVGTLDMLTQQKLKSLAAQRDQVEIAHVKYVSCLEYAESGLKTCTEEEVLAMKDQLLTRIEQINEEFDPETIQPKTKADLKYLTQDKDQLQTACQQFTKVVIDPLSTDNSFIDQERVIKVGEQKSVHNINYQPARRGKHDLHVTQDGTHVRGSPCLINVIPSPQSLNRPVMTVEDMNKPEGTAVNSRGQIVVTEREGHCISILNPEGGKIVAFGTRGSGNGQLSHPSGVTVDRDDNIYVVDTDNRRVQKFTSEGKFVASVGSNGSNHSQFNYPTGICFHNKTNTLYVCDTNNHRIQVLSTDLKFKSSFGTHGSGYGQLQSPCYIAVDNTNKLYVTDKHNHRVQVFNAEGQFLRAFTNKANNEKLKHPYAIAIDSNNIVYVSEDGRHYVSIFTSLGEYITNFGKHGTKEGQFKYVYGLSIDENDSIIVSDYSNGRLQIF